MMCSVELHYQLEEDDEGEGRLTITVPESYEEWAKEFMDSANLVFLYKDWRD